MGSVRVHIGDCVSSIAADAILSPAKVWAANDALAARRDNPNLLAPGDVVELPELAAKTDTRATGLRHVFQVKAETTLLRLRLLRADLNPRAGLEYTITIDGGDTRTGTTDDDGQLEEVIPAIARQVTIALTENDNDESYLLPLGTIWPMTTVKGAQQRLLNLGFDVGEPDGDWGPRSRAAMREYQTLRELRPTGALDAASRDDLKATHGC